MAMLEFLQSFDDSQSLPPGVQSLGGFAMSTNIPKVIALCNHNRLTITYI